MPFVRSLSNLSSSIEEKGERLFNKRPHLTLKRPHNPFSSKSKPSSPPSAGPKVLLSKRNVEEFFNPDYEADAHAAYEDDHPGKICVSAWVQQLPPVSNSDGGAAAPTAAAAPPTSSSSSQSRRRPSRPNLEHRFTTCGHPECHLRDDTTEAVDGALPVGMNNPQKPAYGLYCEKLSGTAFTAPRHENKQTWLYRIMPASAHEPFEHRESSAFNPNADNKPHEKIYQIPNQLRWDPFDLDETVDWVHSLHLVAGAGDPTMKSGIGIYIYAAGKDMDAHEAFYSADGDFLIVPQHGSLNIQTELGKLLVKPGEICIIPRGIRYRVALPEGAVRGYILELYQGHFELPELGPIGSHCLANPQDFQAPVAAFDEDYGTTWHVLSKFNNQLFAARQNHTPFDVVAWSGTYYPFKYDLNKFATIGAVRFDHPDPSIYTVLTAQSDHPGTAIADFVIFPPRWLVQENTFRPPWYHRNTMSEFMGLIQGEYDAKTGGGFQPAGASLHNVMSAHGPDASTHEKASNATLQPVKAGEGSMAFMFESTLMVGVTEFGLNKCGKVQKNYNDESWVGLKPHFKRPETNKGDANNTNGSSQ